VQFESGFNYHGGETVPTHSILVGNERIRGTQSYQTNKPSKTTAVTSKTEYTPRYMPVF
jgi:hypothetical protein